jgi:UDP:flavonoid glycosyltransferase YjiC (YdhE family)
MYALFTAVPLVGHINPLLQQAETLQRRGWRVAIASTSEMADHVAREHPTLPFMDLGALGGIASQLKRDQESASLDVNFPRGALRIVRGLTTVWPMMFDGLTAAVRRERPDVMVVDLLSSAGMCVAEANVIPFVVNNPDLLACLPVQMLPPADHLPMLFSGQSVHDVRPLQKCIAPLLRRLAAMLAAATLGRDLNRLRRGRGLYPIKIHEMLRGRPILVDGAFGLEYERKLPPNIHMTGPMLPAQLAPLPEEMRVWLEQDPPVVYVNLGTLAVAPRRQLLEMFHGLTGGSFRVLWILKAAQAAALPRPSPTEIRIQDWGPAPLSILSHPNVCAIVSHCGINSVYEAVHSGKPIVGIPMLADQRDMGARIADAGVGVCLDKTRFRAKDLRQGLDCVLQDPSFTLHLGRLRQTLARAGGTRRAADLIEEASRP